MEYLLGDGKFLLPPIVTAVGVVVGLMGIAASQLWMDKRQRKEHRHSIETANRERKHAQKVASIEHKRQKLEEIYKSAYFLKSEIDEANLFLEILLFHTPGGDSIGDFPEEADTQTLPIIGKINAARKGVREGFAICRLYFGNLAKLIESVESSFEDYEIFCEEFAKKETSILEHDFQQDVKKISDALEVWLKEIEKEVAKLNG